MHPLLQARAGRRLGVFTSQEALAVGYTVDEIRTALRTGRWMRLRKGVYVTADARAAQGQRGQHLIDCLGVLLSLRPGPVVSHASAARLHGLLVPASAGAEVRVTDTVQWRRGRGYRVARAALPDDDLVDWRAGYRATSVARTIVDCGREWGLMDAVTAMDAALHGRLVTRSQLLAAVLSARHRTGASDAARALGLSDGRAESPLETEARLTLLSSGLPPPELQVELHDSRGFVARLDAWYDDAAVAIEFDGRVKYLEPRDDRSPGQVLWEEKRREDRVRALGVRMVRLGKWDLGAAWPSHLVRIERLLATPSTEARAFTVVRRPEPGADVGAA